MKRLAIIAILAAALCVGANAQEKFYEVKSGIVTMQTSIMGQNTVQHIYFDDYGAKQATIMEFGGERVRSIEIDGSNVMINDTEKTAIRMPAMGASTNRINFTDKSEKNIKKNKIKEIGTDTVAGKPCTKYTVAVLMMGQVIKQTVSVYKGITLMSSTKTNFGEAVQIATKVVEDVEIPASTFTLPEGVQIQEMDMGMMGGF